MDRENKKTSSAMALLKLLIFIAAAIALICYFVFPVSPNNSAQPKVVRCSSSIAAIASLMNLYSADYKSMSTAEKWNDLMFKYVGQIINEYQCPSIRKASNTCGYVLNENIFKVDGPIPPDMVLLFEGPPGWNQTGGPEMIVYRHKSSTDDKEVCSIALADGTAMSVEKDQVQNLKWKP